MRATERSNWTSSSSVASDERNLSPTTSRARFQSKIPPPLPPRIHDTGNKALKHVFFKYKTNCFPVRLILNSGRNSR